MIHQIAYISLSSTPLSPNLLGDIIDVSRRNNRRRGITSVLMYHDRLFFQVLEGSEEAVRCVYYEHILKDPRHSALSLVWDGMVDTRSFPHWTMEYAGPDKFGKHNPCVLPPSPPMEAVKSANCARNSVALELAKVVFRDT